MRDPFVDALVAELRKSSAYRLSAIIEMATLTPSAHKMVMEHYSTHSWPLLQHPQLANLQNTGPWLFSTRPEAGLGSQYDFQWQIDQCAEGATCGWIISALPPASLARHLSQANLVTGPDGHPYLLRYHTSSALEALAQHRALPGISEWLAPVNHWWIPRAHPKQGMWVKITGGNTSVCADVPPIHLDEACWAALAGDPLSYRLAEMLSYQNASTAFAKPCRGTRIGLIDHYLDQAREQGLKREQDLITYVLMMARNGDQLENTPTWQNAISATLEQHSLLADNLQAGLPTLDGRGSR